MKEEMNLQKKLSRIIKLIGTDEGFYLLALHSFIEYYISIMHDQTSQFVRFTDKLGIFREYLQKKFNKSWEELKVIIRIQREHRFTNMVRHEFEKLGKEEANAGTFNFLKFCKLCNFPQYPELDTLNEELKLWDDRKSPAETSLELKNLKYQHFLAQRNIKELVSKIDNYEKQLMQQEQLTTEIRRFKEQLEYEKNSRMQNSESIKQLQDKIDAIEKEKQELLKKNKEYEPLETYLNSIERLSLYTRTRMDYEKMITKLTPEQISAIDCINIEGDYLIKGAAGTGKTIVLLGALKKVKEKSNSEKTIVLLTYTKTLVKYSQYLSTILSKQDYKEYISTADSYFLKILKMLKPQYSISYTIMNDLCKQYNSTDFFSNQQLFVEIEDFIIANNITEQEYIDKRIIRKGLKKKLNNAQRSVVWNIYNLCKKEMEDNKLLSKNYSRLKILEAMSESDNTDVAIDTIFVDETQDLTSCELAILKNIAKKGVVLAGDVYQSIYCPTSPYARSNIKLTGRTKVLRLNFRNTQPIHDIAERFRIKSDTLNDYKKVPVAFRDGPLPELFYLEDQKVLLQCLVDKVDIFIRHLHYDPGNICILAPAKKEENKVQDVLISHGHNVINIKEETFSFFDDNFIRISTFHSSKGIDIPVVLMYLPILPPVQNFDAGSVERLQRNLIYVGMTRALDNLNIFVSPAVNSPVITDLIEVFDEYHRSVFSKEDQGGNKHANTG